MDDIIGTLENDFIYLSKVGQPGIPLQPFACFRWCLGGYIQKGFAVAFAWRPATEDHLKSRHGSSAWLFFCFLPVTLFWRIYGRFCYLHADAAYES